MTQDELLQLIAQAQREGWEKLDLKDRGIKELPAKIGRLSQLSSLDLSNNHLAELPAEIGQLSQLKRLFLGDNPWNDVFADLVKSPREELFSYLRS